jgi:hypothetical protein
MPSARRPYGDLNVLAEGSQKIDETLHGEVARLPAHQTRNMRLPDAKDLSSRRLGDSAVFDKPVDLQREARLDPLALGIGKAQISKDVAATFFDPNSAILPHLSSALLCNPALPRRAAV